MAKTKLLEDIKANPGRFYRLPGDVARDRRFNDGERLEILQAWAHQADAGRIGQIEEAIADVRRRLTPNNHAAE
jgi:hypothetical protein